MGGVINYCGNIGLMSEWNIVVDLEVGYEVFEVWGKVFKWVVFGVL